MLQFFHGFKEIILLGKRLAFIDSYKVHSRNKSRIQAIQSSTNALPRMVIEVLFVGLFVITILILCSEHETPIQMIGILGGYLYVGFRLMPGLNRLIGQLNLLKSTIPSIERVYNEYNTIAKQDNYINDPNFQFNKQIELKNIVFSYPNTTRAALEDVNAIIQKGECIGVVGETGSGKSTLVDVMLGLLNPNSGSVSIDGQYNVNSLQWHQKIGYVPQAIYLIDDTIAANIAFGEKSENIDFERLDQVIKDAQLFDFIKQLPNGTQTITGERGIRLSGGERQRIAIARALYRNPEVLIFDEATSALDNQTEARLMETIYSVSRNHTVIMIAHRLTTLENCDRILKMTGGCLQEIKPFKEKSWVLK